MMVRLCLALVLLAGCSLPPEAAREGAPPSTAAGRPAGSVVLADSSVRTVQLHVTSQEVSLPILTLGSTETLTLSFDRLNELAPGAAEISFRHIGLDGPSSLLPTEYLTGFERDDIRDIRMSGATAIPYTHYEYTFPNSQIGFRLSGKYELAVTDVRTGGLLFAAPFFVVEPSAEVQLAFGATLLDGAVGNAIQPAARLSPGPRLDAFDAFQFTVCFVRNGRLDDVRCAPEPRLVDLALYQFYLPRSEAFAAPDPMFEFDIGGLDISTEVIQTDRSARPPTATLDLDVAAFGGDVREAVVGAYPLIEGAFIDPGEADTDAEYVEVEFRYVPPDERRVSGPVNVVGSFSGWTARSDSRMTWDAEAKRYEGTLLLKQGVYVYEYEIPLADRRRVLSVGQPSLFTAFVYLRDNQLFTDRLVAVQSGVAR